MRHFKTVTNKKTEEQRYMHTTCDFCGDENRDGWGTWRKDRGFDNPHPDLNDGQTDIEVEMDLRVRLETKLDTRLKLQNGYWFPEGGSGHQIELDCCPKCFMEKIVPLAMKPPDVTEWDY